MDDAFIETGVTPKNWSTCDWGETGGHLAVQKELARGHPVYLNLGVKSE
jgi:hypothetical protein